MIQEDFALLSHADHLHRMMEACWQPVFSYSDEDGEAPEGWEFEPESFVLNEALYDFYLELMS